MNCSVAAASARATSASNSAGAMRLKNSAVAAALRLCTSSPMLSACAISGFSSIGPLCANTARSVGAITAAIVRRRLMTSGPLAPKRSTLPRPSLKLQYARLPAFLFSTTNTGIDGLMMPAIGPTAPW
jgi:hypothetical protein